MRRILCTVFAVQLGVAAANGQGDDSFRFFFDTVGGTEQGSRDPANLAFTNPTIAGSGRMYMYLQYGNAGLDFSGIDLTVTVEGPGVLTEGNLYNHVATTGLSRWMVMPNRVFGPNAAKTRHEFGSTFKVAAGGYGAKNTGSVETEDTHFDRTDGDPGLFGTTLLGFVDVAHTGAPGVAEVRVLLGSGGAAGTSGHGDGLINASDYVYLGFGDAAYRRKSDPAPDPVPPDPDGFITPEPTTGALLIVGILAIRKRFQRCA